MNEKKLAAILAATRLFLEQEEAEAAARVQFSEPLAAPAARLAPEPGQWAQSCRQEMMGGRRMIQLRAFANARSI